MENIKYELFKFDESLPLKIFIYKLGDIKPHWHQELELIYVLEGYTEIVINDHMFVLNQEDIILTNAYDIHELHGSDAVILSVQIDLEKLGVPEDEREGLTFDCNSSLEIDKTPYQKIKVLIASLINYNLKYQDNSRYANLSILYSLFAEFMNKYRVISNSKKTQPKKYLARLREIIKYLNDNYNKGITLKELSNVFDLTVPYISSFFDKYFGNNFQDYYDELRISKSIPTLLENKLTLDDMAIKFGFTDARGYVRAFKKIYNTTPTEYRKGTTSSSQSGILLTQFDTNKYLDKLLKNNDQKYHLPLKKHKNSIIKDFEADCNNSSPLKPTYLNFFTVSRAFDFLSKPHQEMIEDLLSEIPFKYVKFHGILDDTMHVIKKRGDTFTYSFFYIDMVLDYIMKLGIKPLIQLSYMPSCLTNNMPHYDNGMIVSLPNNDEEFLKLIKALVIHLIERYGIKEVESWPFTFWNAPDTSKYAYGVEDTPHFLKLYKEIYNIIKQISSKIEFGSPSLLPLCDETKKFDKVFLDYARNNDCYPDFLIVHYFENNFSNYFKQINKEQFPTDPNNFKKFIDYIKSPDFYYGKKVYLTEFNFTISHRNLLSDTIFSSCYIVKNILENLNRLDSYGHWYLSDLIDETQLPNNMLHGGLGFYTVNGIRKPAFYAYKFLSKLGPEIILQNEGIIITKRDQDIIILLYNYEHFSNLYASGDYFELSYHNRYIPFAANKNIIFNINLKNVPGKSYHLKQTYINRSSGSIYDVAENAGFFGLPDPETKDFLKNLSTPQIQFKTGTISNKELSFDATVSPLEIRLIEIKLYDTYKE